MHIGSRKHTEVAWNKFFRNIIDLPMGLRHTLTRLKEYNMAYMKGGIRKHQTLFILRREINNKSLFLRFSKINKIKLKEIVSITVSNYNKTKPTQITSSSFSRVYRYLFRD